MKTFDKGNRCFLSDDKNDARAIVWEVRQEHDLYSSASFGLKGYNDYFELESFISPGKPATSLDPVLVEAYTVKSQLEAFIKAIEELKSQIRSGD